MKLQQEFFERQQERSQHQLEMQHQYSAKEKEQLIAQATAMPLPKLDIVSFNGNKLYWYEFWDSFESSVHYNKRLSNIEKFNYLK